MCLRANMDSSAGVQGAVKAPILRRFFHHAAPDWAPAARAAGCYGSNRWKWPIGSPTLHQSVDRIRWGHQRAAQARAPRQLTPLCSASPCPCSQQRGGSGWRTCSRATQEQDEEAPVLATPMGGRQHDGVWQFSGKLSPRHHTHVVQAHAGSKPEGQAGAAGARRFRFEPRYQVGGSTLQQGARCNVASSRGSTSRPMLCTDAGR